MAGFMEFMQNAWVVGIAGGIISGIVVYYITSCVLDRKKKSEHKRNIVMANNAVLDLLRPYIANSGLPDKKQLEVIVNSVSREYRVKKSEMNPIRVFYEDLVTEFIGNLYIPDEVKKENIRILLENIEGLEKENDDKIEQKQVRSVKGKTSNSIELLAGLLSAIVSIFAGVVGSSSGKGSFNLIVGIISVLVILIIVIVGVGTSIKTYKMERLCRDNSIGIKTNYFINSENIKLRNHGADLNTLYKDEFSFINYFSDEE